MLATIAVLALLSCAGSSSPDAPEPRGLVPLSEYTSDTVEGMVLLWHPGFHDAMASQAEVRAALVEDIDSLTAEELEGLSSTRIAIASSTPDLLVLPSRGRGIGWHRSVEWLETHGFDRAREGVVEVYNSTDYLQSRMDGRDTLPQLLRRISARSGVPDLPPLSEYRAEPLGQLTVLWSPEMDHDGNVRRLRVRSALLFDWDVLAARVPESALRALAGSRVVVNEHTLQQDGRERRGVATHMSASWLTSHGLDAEREGVVEVYNAMDFLESRSHQPMVLLHELTHVLHQSAPQHTREQLREAYQTAVESGTYDAIQHALAPHGQVKRAYALSSTEEYAAELSEAYFGRNDQFPFTRSDLVEVDPVGVAAIESLWGVPE